MFLNSDSKHVEPKILSESEIMELKKKHGIILFYMNGCGHCEIMKPAWNKVITDLKDKHKSEIILGAVESSSMEMFNKHGIKPSVSGFPTILYFHPSRHNNPEAYKGDRSYEDLKQWILKKKDANGSLTGVTNKNKTIVLLTEYSPNNKNNTPTKNRKVVAMGGGGRGRRRQHKRRTRHHRRLSLSKRTKSRRCNRQSKN